MDLLEMLLRDHKRVPMTHRLNIEKSKNPLIFVNLPARYVTCNDLTEYAIACVHLKSPL
jgi:hypothetical protein